MRIPFLRIIPLMGVVLSMLLSPGAGVEASFAPFPNFEAARWEGISAYSGERPEVPLMFQYDYPDVLATIDGVPCSVLTSGCGAASLAMAVHYYHGELAGEITPQTLFQFAVDEGWYNGDGLGHTTISKVANAFRVRGEWRAGSESRITRALRAGNPIIAHMNTGLFTENTGHYILLVGLTPDGKVLINDPNSALMSTLAFPISTLLREAKTDEPFYFTQKRG